MTKNQTAIQFSNNEDHYYCVFFDYTSFFNKIILRSVLVTVITSFIHLVRLLKDTLAGWVPWQLQLLQRVLVILRSVLVTVITSFIHLVRLLKDTLAGWVPWQLQLLQRVLVAVPVLSHPRYSCSICSDAWVFSTSLSDRFALVSDCQKETPYALHIISTSLCVNCALENFFLLHQHCLQTFMGTLLVGWRVFLDECYCHLTWN